MLKITYTNGDVQNINVTGDFFAITLAPKNGKPVKISPIEKAEDFSFDLAAARGGEVSSVSLFYPGSKDPKVRVFKPEDEREVEEKAEDTKSFIKELKAFKKAGKLQWKEKKYQRWVWQF
jgi:hypothetical protein